RPEGSIFLVEARKPSLLSNVSERAVSVVVIERVSVYATYEDIFVSVIVVVADGDPGVVADACEPCLFGDVCERAVSVIVEQPVPVLRRSLLEGGDVSAVRKENVEIAVIVVIEDGDAAGHGLRRVALGSLVAI